LLAFAVHFLVLARTRLSDYAVLEANGMGQSVIRGSLLVEQGIVLGFCVVVGVALGLIASAAVLPGLQLGTSAVDNVPQTLVTVDPRLLLLVLGAVAGGAALLSPLIAVSTERPHLMAELRALG
ncbi:MAG TPA: FtsX-like permease family protein, partial [Candidatus Dormibacteraeota bacterium]|nr:FtsX-like permease family protein [Candidatus Dormibacteraeota bacterium]